MAPKIVVRPRPSRRRRERSPGLVPGLVVTVLASVVLAAALLVALASPPPAEPHPFDASVTPLRDVKSIIANATPTPPAVAAEQDRLLIRASARTGNPAPGPERSKPRTDSHPLTL